MSNITDKEYTSKTCETILAMCDRLAKEHQFPRDAVADGLQTAFLGWCLKEVDDPAGYLRALADEMDEVQGQKSGTIH